MKKKLIVHSSSISKRDRLWWPSVNGQPGTVYPDSTFDVTDVPVAPGTNTLTATCTGPAFTNVPMTATDTSTIVLGKFKGQTPESGTRGQNTKEGTVPGQAPKFRQFPDFRVSTLTFPLL